MFKKTWNVVLAHIQDVQEKDTVVIVYNTIGNIKNCQDASSLKMLRRHLTGLWKTSLKYGVRS
jgi:hypothetical protein